ncbi:MAG: C40 family peptidase [Treponemataceae bacterium]|nr:C40 family peptidase [Treponemataceae bacterium]
MTEKRGFIFFLLLVLLVSSFSIYAESSDSAALNKRNQLIENAKQLLGTPYVYGGTSKNGIDCSGLIFLAAKGIGLSLPRTASQICSYSRIIEDSGKQAGDLLFFSEDGKNVSHVAIYIGDGQMIHAASAGTRTGVIISKLTESYWKRTYYCTGRILDPVSDAASTTNNAGQSASSGNIQTPGTGSTQPTGSGSTQTPSISNTQPTASSNNQTSSTGNTQSIPSSGIIIASINKEDKETKITTPNRTEEIIQNAKPEEETASQSSDSTQWINASNFLNNIGVDFSLSGGWTLFNTKKFGLIFRGVDIEAAASYLASDMKPGLGLAVDYDPSMSICQIKLLVSATLNDYIRIYAGPVFTIGTPVLPNTSKKIGASIFPGILGASFQTPSLNIGNLRFSLYQDISVTVFNKADGAALSILDTAASSIKFQTGLRVTIPHL